MSHLERLETDLAVLRSLYDTNRGNDSEFDTDLLAVIGRCIGNLAKARKTDDEFVTVEETNEHGRSEAAEFAAASGRDDVPCYELPMPAMGDYDIQLATLVDLREQLILECGGDEPNARRIGKVVTAIIRAEIQLWQTGLQIGFYLQKDAVNEFIEAHMALVIQWSITAGVSPEDWERSVYAFVGDCDC